jgi:hypothetical protein
MRIVAREAHAMPDYEPTNLSHLCNAGAAFISSDARPPIVSQLLHGLPFAIGGDAARCFTGFGGEVGERPGTRGTQVGAGASPGRGGARVTVPLGRTARRVLFAHALLESAVMEREKLGRVVAHYVFRYADGEEVRVPIRERRESCVVAKPAVSP